VLVTPRRGVARLYQSDLRPPAARTASFFLRQNLPRLSKAVCRRWRIDPRITFRLTRVNRTTFRLRRHNRTRVDEIADQHLKERKQRRRSKLAVC
jgi:hypothetical protein